MGTFTTAPESRRRTAYVIAGQALLILLLLGPGEARAAQAPVTITQDWPLLSETISGVTAAGTNTFPIKRGTLPGGASTFSPQPSATFEIVGRVTGASGGGGWEVQLQDYYGAAIAGTTFTASHTSFTLRSASFAWPGQNRILDRLQASPIGATSGVLDIRAATVRIRQSGTIQKTVGRVPLATRQSGILTEVATRVDEPAFYTHLASDFDPAPVVRLRATGALTGIGQHIRVGLHDSAGTEVGAAYVPSTVDATPYSVYSVPFSLTDGQTYEVRVSVSAPDPCNPNCNGPSQQSASPGGDLLSAELELAQSTTDPAGIEKTVGWYPSVTAGVDATSNNQVLNFPFRAPENLVPETSASFEVAAKRVAGTGQVGASLSGLSGTATPTTASGSYVALHKAMTLLPSPGQQLDTKAALTGSGTTGRFSSSRIRQALTLHDLVAPDVVAPFTASAERFSPTPSGEPNEVSFGASVRDFSDTAWTIEIAAPDDSVVASAAGSEPGGATANVSFVWDGLEEGAPVPDATYTATFEAIDGAGNAVQDTLDVIVDATGPAISPITASADVIAPGGHPQHDSTDLSATLADGAGIAGWSLTIEGASGEVARFEGSATAVSATWDGLQGPSPVPDGPYTASLVATDELGNVAAPVTTAIQTDASAPALASALAASPSPFSPNGDGIKDASSLAATLADAHGPVSWSLVIKDAAGADQASSSGTGLDPALTWDETSGADLAPDAAYTATLTATDAVLNEVSVQTEVVVDTTPPVLGDLIASTTHLSPNGDGIKDSASFAASMTEPSLPVAYDLVVTDALGTALRTISASGSAVAATWDGRDDAGTVVPDAPYTITATVTDDVGNAAEVSTSVTIDTVVPVITGYQASEAIISPNGDGSFDETELSATIGDASPITSWIIQTFRWGEVFPPNLSGSGSVLNQTWAGPDPAVSDGVYDLVLRATDAAGNTAHGSVPVRVDTQGPQAGGTFVATPNPFSPNADDYKDQANLSASLTDVTGVGDWDITVVGVSGSPIASGAGASVAGAWDGTDDAGNVVADGLYTIRLTARDTVDNAATVDYPWSQVDTTGPAIANLRSTVDPFSPNADGAKDATRIKASLSDVSGPISWSAAVRDAQGNGIRTFTGTGTGLDTLWDGLDEEGDPVPDGTYEVILTATDDQLIEAQDSIPVLLDTAPPTVTGFPATQRFSPNGDGSFDLASFQGTIDAPSAWTLSVSDPDDGSVLYSATGSGTNVDGAWDGSGASQDGAYDVTLEMTDQAANVAVVTAEV
ncbi:MAG TPA: FlgD immunoglobulin-like domain containing protein, partial [Actinomycetota bacterium]